MRSLFVLAGLVACCSTASLASAAAPEIEVIQGPVYIATDDGMIPAVTGMIVGVGQSVLLKGRATALLSDSETGCFVSLRVAGSYRVPDMSHCHAGSAMILKTGYQVIPTNGGTYLPAAPGAGFAPVAIGLGFAGVVASAAAYNIVVEDGAQISGP
jgi:hypothetical protein